MTSIKVMNECLVNVNPLSEQRLTRTVLREEERLVQDVDPKNRLKQWLSTPNPFNKNKPLTPKEPLSQKHEIQT